MTFIQIIEYRTDRIDEVNATRDAWIEQTAGRRNVTRGTQARGARIADISPARGGSLERRWERFARDLEEHR